MHAKFNKDCFWHSEVHREAYRDEGDVRSLLFISKESTCTIKSLEKKMQLIQKTPLPESASELYRPSDRYFSAKLVPTFAGIGCHVVSVTDTYGRILGFLDRSRSFFFKVARQLYP
jgi:hypothetical protein